MALDAGPARCGQDQDCEAATAEVLLVPQVLVGGDEGIELRFGRPQQVAIAEFGPAISYAAATGMQAIEGTIEASGISADGRVLVGIYQGPASTLAYVWTASRGVMNLQSLLGPAVPAGWRLESAAGASAGGLRIAGTGTNPQGRNEAFVVTLTPEMLGCYANCDESSIPPVLNVNDFLCFQNRFAEGDTRANCDQSTAPPVLNVNDFVCSLARYAAGCG